MGCYAFVLTEHQLLMGLNDTDGGSEGIPLHGSPPAYILSAITVGGPEIAE